MKPKLLIIGSNGQLGSDMVYLAHKEGYQLTGIDFPDIDITNSEKTNECILNLRPDFIINCAAYTAVDNCESDQKAAYAVNAQGPGNIAIAAKKNGATLIHISTDYVFNGSKTTPYTEDDKPDPLTVYGKSKLEGEQLVAAHCEKHMIFRIAWLYGINGNNFVKTIRNVAKTKAERNERLTVVNDQFGTPTYTREVCRQIFKLIEQPHYGIFHCTNEGQCSWFDFAGHIINTAGIKVDLVPCTTKEFPRPAPRPQYSVLENAHLKRLHLNVMTDWKTAFSSFISDESKS